MRRSAALAAALGAQAQRIGIAATLHRAAGRISHARTELDPVVQGDHRQYALGHQHGIGIFVGRQQALHQDTLHRRTDRLPGFDRHARQPPLLHQYQRQHFHTKQIAATQVFQVFQGTHAHAQIVKLAQHALIHGNGQARRIDLVFQHAGILQCHALGAQIAQWLGFPALTQVLPPGLCGFLHPPGTRCLVCHPDITACLRIPDIGGFIQHLVETHLHNGSQLVEHQDQFRQERLANHPTQLKPG